MYLITGEVYDFAAIKAYTLPSIVIPLLKGYPADRKIVSGHNILTYVSFIQHFPGMVFLIPHKTRPAPARGWCRTEGSVLRSVVSVLRRLVTFPFFLSGILCGFGGAFMSMGWVASFMKNMVNGRGYIGLSASNIANGNPVGSAIASVFLDSVTRQPQHLRAREASRPNSWD